MDTQPLKDLPSYAIAQLGARMHYAVPRILQNSGLLELLFTDICVVKDWPRLIRVVPEKFRPAGLKRLLDRVPDGVPPQKIKAFTIFGMEYFWRRSVARNRSESTFVHLWAGRTFCNLVLKNGLKSASAVYTFNSAGLELLRTARKHGMQTVTEQTIAPREIEQGLMIEEHILHPDWEEPWERDQATSDYIEREKAEWDQADTIVCASEFVRDSIKMCGGPAERCVVVPYGVDRSFSVPRKEPAKGPLRVLTVGAICLRKGSQYVLGAAGLLKGKALFRMVGPLRMWPKTLQYFPQNVDLSGPVPRSQIIAHYAWADVFLLPSLCEGSATVTYEALACGLPVISTFNTGSVVRDGIDGFLVPIRDPEAIAERLDMLATNQDLLREMSHCALERGREFDLPAYGRRLLDTLCLVMKGS